MEAEQPVPAQPNLTANGSEVAFSGRIDSTATDAFIALLQSAQFQTFRIDSAGGDVVAAIRMARAIHEHGLRVVVSHICSSSCANYVFPAGHSRRIEEGAFIWWHGDARQWNFVAEMQRLLTIQENGDVSRLSEHERRWLKDYSEVVRQQDDLYRRIGVRDGLARIGHDAPVRLRAWTVPVGTMAKYGIRNVDAPLDYGTEEYCRKWASRYLSGGSACLTDLPSQVPTLVQ